MSEEKSKEHYYLGVDLGGAKILAGVFGEDLKLLGKNKIRTKPERGFEEVVQRIARCVLELADDFDIKPEQMRGLGIGAPGSISQDGDIIFAGNLKWKDAPLKKKLEEKLKIPVFIENDCNIAALGIYHKELKGVPENMVGIFLGTGVGAGLILNRQLYRGSHLTAGEIGHTVLDVHGEKCNCGNRGCFELFASRSAIFRRIDKAIQAGEKSLLAMMSDGRMEDLRSGDLLKAMNRGDECVRKVVDEAAEYTGIAVANVVNLLNPDIIVLGGGIIDALEERMMPIIERVAREHAFPGTEDSFKVQSSKLGDDAGITGAAVLAKQKLEGRVF